MRAWFIALSILFCARALAADCEAALTTSLAKVTEAALQKGDVKVEEILDLVNAKVPFNPLRFRTPGSTNAALSRFYTATIAKHATEGDWEIARAELTAILKNHGVEQKLAGDARAQTRIVPVIETAEKIEDIRKHNISWYRSGNGRLLYGFFNWSSGLYEIREVGRKDVVAEVPNGGWFRQNTLGHAEYFTLKASKKTLLERMMYPFLHKEAGEAFDLETGIKTKISRFFEAESERTNYVEGGHEPGSEIVITGGGLRTALSANSPYPSRPGEIMDSTVKFVGDSGPALMAVVRSMKAFHSDYYFNYFADGKWRKFSNVPVQLPNRVEKAKVYALDDGRLAMTAIMEEGFHSYLVMPFKKDATPEVFSPQTALGAVDQMEVLKFGDRFLVTIASDSQNPIARSREIEVFEPDVSHRRIFNISFGVPVQIATFAFENRFFLLTKDDATGEVSLFEPLLGNSPLLRAHVPGQFFGVVTDREGVPYLVQEQFDPSAVTFYRLFGHS